MSVLSTLFTLFITKIMKKPVNRVHKNARIWVTFKHTLFNINVLANFKIDFDAYNINAHVLM